MLFLFIVSVCVFINMCRGCLPTFLHLPARWAHCMLRCTHRACVRLADVQDARRHDHLMMSIPQYHLTESSRTRQQQSSNSAAQRICFALLFRQAASVNAARGACCCFAHGRAHVSHRRSKRLALPCARHRRMSAALSLVLYTYYGTDCHPLAILVQRGRADAQCVQPPQAGRNHDAVQRGGEAHLRADVR